MFLIVKLKQMQRQHQVEQRIILKNVRQQIQLQENNEGKKNRKIILNQNLFCNFEEAKSHAPDLIWMKMISQKMEKIHYHNRYLMISHHHEHVRNFFSIIYLIYNNEII